MPTDEAVKRVVVGVDGSQPAAEALKWAITYARLLNAEVVAVFAIPRPISMRYLPKYAPPVVPPELDPEWRAEMKRELEQQWCKPLISSALRFRILMEDGRPASVIAGVADRENAELVVVGRRGRGPVAEQLLGSVSHELSHRCKRPILLI